MVDVFISYKREEKARCERIANKLKALDLDVWFDARMTSGASFDREIETNVKAAKAVLVLWSPASVESDWVRIEAGKEAWALAREADNLGTYQAYLRRFPNGANSSIARQRIAALTPRPAPPPPAPAALPSPPPSPPALHLLDARTTPASTRAPLVRDPSRLPDFALFRECESCPEMVVIPAGNFLMGSPQNEAERGGYEDDRSGPGGRQVNVRVPRFAIGRFETTWDEWDACVKAGFCQQRRVDIAEGDQGLGRERRPLSLVDWNDAGMFARWVNGQIGAAAPSPRAVGGGGASAPNPYRRPSEAEWEYAARGGTVTPFSFGETISTNQANYDGDYTYGAGKKGEDRRKTLPVGSFPANPFGLFDLHGNVWEWAEDCWRDNLSGQTAAAVTTSGCQDRVLRGGSWDGSPADLRSANRGRISPSTRYGNFGFRLSRTL